MAKEGYRIDRISIANFRGITEKREIYVAGRHLFLLGQNGFGKSTVVEAIRWCLFGSPPGQQEIEVRNTFNPQSTSEVNIDLKGQKRALNLRRYLSPGAPRSRQDIIDGEGKALLVKNAFPTLARLGQPTGTQVIFAGQHAAGRLQTEISDFSKVLYFYLGIEEIPELLEKLRALSEERRTELNGMAKSLDSFADELRNELEKLQGKKEEIIKNPPWGNVPIPTRSETERKIHTLFHEMACLVDVDKEANAELSCTHKLSKIEEWNETLVSAKRQELETKLNDLQAKRGKLQIIRDDWQKTSEQINSTGTKISELADMECILLGGQNLDDLEAQVKDAEKVQEESALRSEILRLSATYMDKYQPSHCPLCNESLPAGGGFSGGTLSDKDNCHPELEKLRRQVAEIKQGRKELSEQKQILQTLESKLLKIGHDANAITNKHSTTLDDIDELIQEFGDVILSLRRQKEDAQSERDRWKRRISDMAAEYRFHNYQDQVIDIEKTLSVDIEGTRNALSLYDSFLSTSEEIGRLLLISFDEQISFAISPLSDKLSQVYFQLTAHPSYDGVSIVKHPSNSEKVEPGQLELQVTSSKCPGRPFPVNVLNGQAARSLQLIPYFVFSDYWHDLMELDLLLVDDPSESFDTSHLENLMTVLCSVASHTQLVIASHESDRMRPLIEKYFPIEQRCILSVVDFDPYRGPTFECE